VTPQPFAFSNNHANPRM